MTDLLFAAQALAIIAWVTLCRWLLKISRKKIQNPPKNGEVVTCDHGSRPHVMADTCKNPRGLEDAR